MIDELTGELVTYYQRVLVIHGNVSGTCGVCGVRSCPDWRDAYDKLTAAGQLIVSAERLAAITARSSPAPMVTTYVSSAAIKTVMRAQATIDAHLAGSGGYWCQVCQAVSPCGPLIEATKTMRHYNKLPRRTPGVTSQGRSSPGVEGRPARWH